MRPARLGVIAAKHRAGGAPPVVYLLDALALSVTAAYGLRRLRAAYSGAAIRVRRSSDNAEQDIGFTTGGDLDTASMLSFVGASDGTTRIFYDQGGAGANLTETTASRQPVLVTGGVMTEITAGRPGMSTNGAQMMVGSTANNQPFTRNTVLKFLSIAGGINIHSDNVGNSLYTPSAGTLATYAGGTAVFQTGISVNDVASVQESLNSGSSVGRYNASETPMSPGGLACNLHNLGGAYNGGGESPGLPAVFSEYILFPTALGAPDRATIYSSQKLYWGLP